MQGVEILNTIHVKASLVHPLLIAVFLGLILCVCFIGALTIDYEVVQIILNMLVVVFIICFIASFVGALIPTDKIVDTKYQVTISDEVSLTEFYEHYEVIDQDGKIFTVKEKTNE